MPTEQTQNPEPRTMSDEVLRILADGHPREIAAMSHTTVVCALAREVLALRSRVEALERDRDVTRERIAKLWEALERPPVRDSEGGLSGENLRLRERVQEALVQLPDLSTYHRVTLCGIVAYLDRVREEAERAREQDEDDGEPSEEASFLAREIARVERRLEAAIQERFGKDVRGGYQMPWPASPPLSPSEDAPEPDAWADEADLRRMKADPLKNGGLISAMREGTYKVSLYRHPPARVSPQEAERLVDELRAAADICASEWDFSTADGRKKHRKRVDDARAALLLALCGAPVQHTGGEE